MNRGAPEARARGVTVLETLVALLLTLFLAVLLTRLAGGLRAGGEKTIRRMELVEARRVARDLVDEALAGASRRPPDGQGLRVRFWVGWARRCPDGDGWLYRGRRQPDPDRDSLWLVARDGTVGVAALARVASSPCPSPESGARALRLEASSGLDAAALLRVFERGRFTVSDAVRYGRIGTPPQPLTGAVLDGAASHLTTAGGWVELQLAAPGDTLGVDLRWWRP